jgi:integrase
MRLSEARALTYGAIQREARILSVRTLKRRDTLVVREIPLPQALLDAFAGTEGPAEDHIWHHFGQPIPRITAYRWIKRLMEAAGINGPKACPRGLRHAFGTKAILSGVPLHMLQRWMGHASMSTTAIYATVLGPEQLALSDRMWDGADFTSK